MPVPPGKIKGSFSRTSVGDIFGKARVHSIFKRLLKQACLSPMRFHDLRHSAATILLSMGVHVKVVQEILGHANMSMTLDIYGHVLPSMQREAMNGMDNLFQEK